MNSLILKLLILFSSLTFYSQKKISGKIIYKYRIKKEVFNTENKSENIKQVFKNYTRNLENYKDKIFYELQFNNTTSFYKPAKRLYSDFEKGMNFASLITGGKEEIYINKKSNIKIKKIDVFGDFFLIKSNFKNQWELTQETRKIGKYTCFKAVLLKKIKGFNKKEDNFITYAWYTPEIPVNFGPKGYGNLPGLILELEQKSITYYAYKINLNNNKTIVINPPKKGKIISEEEFKKLFRKIDKQKTKK